MALEDELNRLGLDRKEARFYLAALELGQAPVRVIADKAGISRTNAYDVLSRLRRKGTITQVERAPSKARRRFDVVPEDPARHHRIGLAIQRTTLGVPDDDVSDGELGQHRG